MVAVGAGFDTQKEYHSYAADVFVEQPFNGGEQAADRCSSTGRGSTAARSCRRWPKQDTLLVEARRSTCSRARCRRSSQYSRKTFANPLTPKQCVWQAGVAYWMAGHQRNIKVTAGRQHTDGLPDRTQVLAQLQLFYF